MKVVAVVGKSGSGKSYLINQLMKLDSDLHFVKSYTTRAVREDDPKDKDTHTFVDMSFYKQNKHKSISTYTNGEYYNWIDFELFKEDKINIIPIDPEALNGEFSEFCYDNKIELKVIYVSCDEGTRKQRLITRGDEYKDDDHLDLSKLDLDIFDSVYLYGSERYFSTEEESFKNVLKYIK